MKGGAVILGLVVLGVSISCLFGAPAAGAASCAAGVACPLNAGVFAAAGYGAVGRSGQAAFAVILFIAALAAVAAIVREAAPLPDYSRRPSIGPVSDDGIEISRRKILGWRSLLEKSPTAA